MCVFFLFVFQLRLKKAATDALGASSQRLLVRRAGRAHGEGQAEEVDHNEQLEEGVVMRKFLLRPLSLGLKLEVSE